MLLCFACTEALFSQTGGITGRVLDAASNLGLESATVSILDKDSSLVSYKLSDKNGDFLFDRLPAKKQLLLNITYVGYQSFSKLIQLRDHAIDTLNVSLALNLTDTNSVVVTAAIPVRMNGDTLEINPAAFKMKPDAVVEELLNQVPGITIWSDGTITVNGQKVKNFFVDGKPFLGSSDPKIATQNLPKTAIEKIQVYQEYDRTYKERKTQRQDSTLTMNVKLKEDSKTGYFGKISAGYGSGKRFETDFSLQLYNKKTSFGIGGGYNNINKNIDNLQQLFQNNTYRNYNPNLYYVGEFGAEGINKNHSIGGVFVHNFIETSNSRQNNRITVNYNKSGNATNVSNLSLQNRTTSENPQFEKQEGIRSDAGNKHDIGLNYVLTNSYNDELTINGRATFNNQNGRSVSGIEVRNPAGQLQSTNNTTSTETGSNNVESMDLVFSKTDADKPLKKFRVQYNLNNNDAVSERTVQSAFSSYTETAKDTSYNRNYNTHNSSFNTGATFEYGGLKRLLLGRYNLFGIDLSFNQWLNYTRSVSNNKVADFDSTTNSFIDNSNLSYQNKREVFEYTPYLALSKSFFKWSDKFYKNFFFEVRLLDDIKTDKNQSSIATRNLNRNFKFFRYEAGFSHNYTRQEKYQYYTSVNYRKNYEFPSIDQLYPVVDDINAYSIRLGNPNLKNKTNHTVEGYANFNSNNQKSLYTFYSSINTGYTFSLNPVSDSVINDPSGKRIYYYINTDKSMNSYLNLELNLSRKLKKSSIQLTYKGAFNNSKTPNYIDNIYTTSSNNNSTHEAALQFSLRSLMVFNFGEIWNTYHTRQTGQGLTPSSTSLNTTKLGITLNVPNNVTFSSTLNHIYNSSLDDPTILWNAFVSYRFMKQQGELKFSAMDLLKQYQNISNSIDIYGTTTRITNGLQQYFLLTFSYYPRKFGKKELKQKTNEQVW